MAVAMEVAWRAPELAPGGSGSKRAWGADTEKLMQLMMGQFGVKPTLDLLGSAASPSSREFDQPSEFLELDPDQPLPPNWEKCLDLKTGEIYFVNKSTEARTSEDPRKVAPHEFLASKRSETLREEMSLRASTSSASSGESPATQQLSFSTGKQLWSLQLDEPRSTVSLNKTAPNSDLELDLNLSAGGASPSRHQSVCTMEMVEQALKRTEKAMGKRPKLSGSSSFSSLTSARSEPSWSHSSPSTSSSSSSVDISRVSEAESQKDEDALVMGACTRCLTYVMLHKSNPKCPRCESEVPLDSFIAPPSSKRQKLET